MKWMNEDQSQLITEMNSQQNIIEEQNILLTNQYLSDKIESNKDVVRSIISRTKTVLEVINDQSQENDHDFKIEKVEKFRLLAAKEVPYETAQE